MELYDVIERDGSTLYCHITTDELNKAVGTAIEWKSSWAAYRVSDDKLIVRMVKGKDEWPDDEWPDD